MPVQVAGGIATMEGRASCFSLRFTPSAVAVAELGGEREIFVEEPLIAPVKSTSPGVTLGRVSAKGISAHKESVISSKEKGSASGTCSISEINGSSARGSVPGLDLVQGRSPLPDCFGSVDRGIRQLGLLPMVFDCLIGGEMGGVLGATDVSAFMGLDEDLCKVLGSVKDAELTKATDELALMEVVESARPVGVECSDHVVQQWVMENVIDVADRIGFSYDNCKAKGEELLLALSDDKVKENRSAGKELVAHHPSSSWKGERELRGLVCTVKYNGVRGGSAMKDGGRGGGRKREEGGYLVSK